MSPSDRERLSGPSLWILRAAMCVLIPVYFVDLWCRIAWRYAGWAWADIKSNTIEDFKMALRDWRNEG